MAAEGGIPLLIGVTGHREVSPSDALAASEIVTQRLQKIKERYKHTPLILLSPLAEGADRIVADAALALDLELVVPLPASLDKYRNDFKTRESLTHFDSLIRKAKAVFVVPSCADKLDRDEAYAELGRFMAKSCDLLIALWDGLRSRGVGGTADVVDARLATAEPLDWIVISRDGAGPVVRDALGECATLNVDTWSKINEFNTDVEEEYPTSPRPSLFIIADRLAMQFHERQKRARDCAFAFIAAAVLSLETYQLTSTFFDDDRAALIRLLILNLISFGSAIYVVLFARRHAFESKSLDYRALAEGLRLQSLWDSLDFGDDLAALYERRHQADLEWVRKALRSSGRYYRWRSDRCGPHNWREHARTAKASWVRDQERFFSDALRRDERKLHHAHAASFGFFALTIVATAILLFVEFIPVLTESALDKIGPAILPLFDPTLREMAPLIFWFVEFALRLMVEALREPFVFTILVCAAFSALFRGYAERSAWIHHAHEYAHMSELFRAADRELEYLLDKQDVQFDTVRNYFRDLAREALSENSDWLLAHRERPIEVPDH